MDGPVRLKSSRTFGASQPITVKLDATPIHGFSGVCVIRDHDVHGATGVILSGYASGFACRDCLAESAWIVSKPVLLESVSGGVNGPEVG